VRTNDTPAVVGAGRGYYSVTHNLTRQPNDTDTSGTDSESPADAVALRLYAPPPNW